MKSAVAAAFIVATAFTAIVIAVVWGITALVAQL